MGRTRLRHEQRNGVGERGQGEGGRIGKQRKRGIRDGKEGMNNN